MHPTTVHLPVTGMTALAQEAAFNYSVYGPDKIHPVEFDATDSGVLVDWISSRLRTRILVPDRRLNRKNLIRNRSGSTCGV